jgi:hypothetical protein
MMVKFKFILDIYLNKRCIIDKIIFVNLIYFYKIELIKPPSLIKCKCTLRRYKYKNGINHE